LETCTTSNFYVFPDDRQRVISTVNEVGDIGGFG
jgi:hypothetical protein